MHLVVPKARVVNKGKGKGNHKGVSGVGATEAAPDTSAPGTPAPNAPVAVAGDTEPAPGIPMATAGGLRGCTRHTCAKQFCTRHSYDTCWHSHAPSRWRLRRSVVQPSTA